MTDAQDGAGRLEAYLKELRGLLRRLPAAEAAEIVEELRSHVLDSAGRAGSLSQDAVAAALARLGSPAELAALYLTESALARASRSQSPWLILHGIFRWARISVTGVFALLGLLVGYTLAVSFAIAAIVKPFAPDRAGLWRVEDGFSLHLGFGAPPPGGQELMGWWLVPVGLCVGAACVWLTMRFGRWCIRRFRPAPPVAAR